MPLLLIRRARSCGSEAAHGPSRPARRAPRNGRRPRDVDDWACCPMWSSAACTERFLSQVMPAATAPNVVPFHRRREVRWLRQGGGSGAARRRFVLRRTSHRAARNPPQTTPKIKPAFSRGELLDRGDRRSRASKSARRSKVARISDNVQFLDAIPTTGDRTLVDITSHVPSMAARARRA